MSAMHRQRRDAFVVIACHLGPDAVTYLSGESIGYFPRAAYFVLTAVTESFKGVVKGLKANLRRHIDQQSPFDPF